VFSDVAEAEANAWTFEANATDLDAKAFKRMAGAEI